jgi:hypothetical protein
VPGFIIAYYVGEQPAMPEDAADYMERYKAWIVSMGSAVVSPGTPLGRPHCVSKVGGSEHVTSKRLTGFSIINAEGIESALEMASLCPHQEIGSVEVSKLIGSQN